jgi:hypothetical protein
MPKIYACTIPVSKPSTFITTGNMKGEILKRIATIIPPLMILPNSLTANASVLDNSLMILNGIMMNVGSMYVFKYPLIPLLSIPKKGTARNTEMARAAVVESEPVGAS